MQDADSESSFPASAGSLTKKALPPPRIDRTSAPKGNAVRPPQEPRRRRGGDHRPASWGDQLLHSFCARAIHELPSTFPVEHHQGTATIPRAVVAKRADEMLFCTFSHCGPHAWPDGEEVSETLPDAELAIDLQEQ